MKKMSVAFLWLVPLSNKTNEQTRLTDIARRQYHLHCNISSVILLLSVQVDFKKYARVNLWTSPFNQYIFLRSQGFVVPTQKKRGICSKNLRIRWSEKTSYAVKWSARNSICLFVGRNYFLSSQQNTLLHFGKQTICRWRLVASLMLELIFRNYKLRIISLFRM